MDNFLLHKPGDKSTNKDYQNQFKYEKAFFITFLFLFIDYFILFAITLNSNTPPGYIFICSCSICFICFSAFFVFVILSYLPKSVGIVFYKCFFDFGTLLFK